MLICSFGSHEKMGASPPNTLRSRKGGGIENQSIPEEAMPELLAVSILSRPFDIRPDNSILPSPSIEPVITSFTIVGSILS